MQFHTVPIQFFGCINMVYIYHTSIEIPSAQSSYVQFYMVLVWFFMDACTWYQPKVHMYSSIWFFADAYTWYTYTILTLDLLSPKFTCMVLYSSHMVLYRCIYMVYIHHTSIEIPSVQSLHIWFYTVPIRFFTDAYTFVYSHTFYMVPYTSIFQVF